MLTARTCIITGANTGIGKETAVALAKQNARLVLFCRNLEKAEGAREEIVARSHNEAVEFLRCDLSSLSSVKQAADEFRSKYSSLHILINNAGSMSLEREVSADGFERTFATNYVGHFLLTQLLLETMKASAPARIINVSSVGHKMARLDLDDLMMEHSYKGFRAYNNSKLANVLFTYHLAKELEGTAVTVNTLHPGMVETSFADRISFPMFSMLTNLLKPWVKTPEQGAATTIHLAAAPELAATTGTYWKDSRTARSSKISYDSELQQQLWDRSLVLVKDHIEPATG